MPKSLVVVESPAKAKTIEKFLGDGFTVRASIGHVVDLPQSGLCVDVENDFKLTYEVTKKDVIKSLKDELKKASTLYLATDEDREGEAIAYHLLEQLKPRVPVKRMVFHEITKKAIKDALEHGRDVDQGLVDAQETRRTLDRLYGYEVSPVLWRKVKGNLSAGRVQSPSIRLIVARELERMKFKQVSYWDLVARHPTSPAFESTLVGVGGARVAAGKDFDDQGQPKKDVKVVSEAQARALVEGLQGISFTVKSVEEKPSRSSPRPPFMTSTLQQEAGRKLSMSAQQVMRVAQGLYERGFITYMRTDSTNLSETALNAARAQVKELFGEKFLPAEPRQYNRKVKNAQEAHEAIRPAGEAFQTPDEMSKELIGTDLKLYKLIWERTIASQMADSEGLSVMARLEAKAKDGTLVEFQANGRTITFPGYLRAYVESSDDPQAELDDRESPLPRLAVGDSVPVESLEAKGHTTTPPARYTEASLVKKLEELGIGRPSTYASIMGTLQAKYVWKKGTALVPSWVAFAVVKLMEQHFSELVDYQFTAKMENDLDEIAGGTQKKVPYLKEFYFGVRGQKKGLHSLVKDTSLDKIDAAEINSIPLGKGPDGSDIIVKPGRYGPYVKRGEDTASVPEALPPDELTVAKAVELLSAPKGDTPIGVDSQTGLNVYAKLGRFGPYVQLGEVPQAKGKLKDSEKPKTASLLKSMTLETLTLEQALQLLRLPREIGEAEGKKVLAQNGRYGPYLTWGDESRNLGMENEARLFTLTLDEALEILRKPKEFRGRGAPKPPLKTLGPDSVSGKEMVLKEGRFGLYVTDGETNASLRKGDTIEELTPERAQELMAARREYMASPEGQARMKKGGRRAPRAKKAAAVAAPVPQAPKSNAKAAKAAKAKPEKKAPPPKGKPAGKAPKASSKPPRKPKPSGKGQKK
jgi:DNA topoisomerase I